jgi:TRAP-type C4-dicarboxylate transport system substrate-binding protein
MIPYSQKNGVNPALFKSLYQDDKKILSRQVNEAEERNGQLQVELG